VRFPIVILALLASVVHGATIYQTNLLSAAGTALNGTVTFSPARYQPLWADSSLIDADPVTAVVTNGVINSVLAAGSTTSGSQVHPDAQDSVPTGTGTNALQDITVTAFPGYTPQRLGSRLEARLGRCSRSRP